MVAAVRSWWKKHPAWAWGVISVLTVGIVVGAFVLSASGLTDDLHPDATVSNAQWVATTDLVTDVASTDGATVYHTARNAAGTIVYSLGAPVGSGTITSVDLVVVAQRGTAARTLTVTPVLGGTDGAGFSPTLTTTMASFTSTGIARPGGGAWSWADLGALQLRLYTPAPGANGTRVDVDEVFIRVNYTGATATIGDGAALSSPVNVGTGDINVVLDSFTLTSSGAGTVNTVTVTKTGTAAVSALDIYSDADGDGVIDAGDISVGSGTFGAPITIDEAVSTTSASYMVVADIDAAAADGSSVTGRVTLATGTGISGFTYGDTTSRTASVVHTVVAIGNGTALSTPVTVAPGQTDVVVDAFSIARSQGTKTPSVSSVTVTKTGTAVVSAVDIYNDLNGNGAIDVGDDVSIGSGAFGAPISITPQAINATKSYLIVVDIDGTATNGTSVSGTVTQAAGTNADSFTYGDTTSRTADVVTITATVGDGASLSTPLSVGTSDADIVLDSFTLTSTGVGTINTVTVTKTGTAAVSALDIYSDADGDGVVDAGDISVGSGTFGAPITINRAVSAVSTSYMVVADIDAAATDAASVTGRVTAAAGAGISSFTYNDNTSRTVNVLHTVVTVGDGMALSTPVTVAPGGLDVVVDAFILSRAQGTKTPSVSSITVTKTGIAAVSAVDIYNDANGDGDIDVGDVSIGSGTFGAPIAITPQVIDFAKAYLVVVDIDGAAADGTSVTGKVTAAAGTDVNSFDYIDNASRIANVVIPPTQVTIGDGTADPGPSSILPSQTGVPVDRLRIERTGGAQAGAVTTLAVTRTGLASVSTVYIYTDANNDGSMLGETLLGSSAFAALTVNIDIIDQSIGPVGAPAYYLVVFDMGAGSEGQATSASITAATGSGTPVPAFTFSDTGQLFTISTADTQNPTSPTGLTAAAGAVSPSIAVLNWSASNDNVAVTGYRVFRATTAGGPFTDVLGTTTLLTYTDTSGVTGQDYWYKVAAYDAAGNESPLSAVAGPVRATWLPPATPHDTYSSTTKLCFACHAPHQAGTRDKIFRDVPDGTGEISVCFTCHDGSMASDNIKVGPKSFGQGSGHKLESVEPATDLTNLCSSCHSPHKDYDSSPMLPRGTVNGAPVTAAANSLCLACHDYNNSWYGAGYPSSAAPTVDATGYPTLGTYPTNTAIAYIAYGDASRNAHLAIPARSGETTRAAGDCLYCHTSHGSASAYDGLTARFQPPTVVDEAAPTYDDYATLCFQCHGTEPGGAAVQPVAGATNIQQFVNAQGARSGHRIVTAGGTYAVGAPVPCYECHNPHGTTRNNGHMFSDVLGESLDTTTVATPTAAQSAQIRQFCFTCHTTAGDDSVTPDNIAYAWNSVSGLYEAVAAGKKVAGLARDAALDANVVRLPAVSGHYRDDAQSCYKCHGANYSAGGSNVHNPSGGVSDGGVACYSCHTSYQAPMEDGIGAKVGDQRVSVYHHVMGSAANEGDFAPAVTPDLTGYPTGYSSGMYCLTCHVDHDKFNATPGSNLRRNAVSTTDGAPYATNTDWDPTAPFAGGLCTSCHTLALPRDTTDQKAAGTQNAVQSVDSASYNSSAHQYKVSSEFGTGNSFLADCSKCHTDEQAKEFQTSANTFGTHWSAERSILTALGGTASDPMGETHCYGCHTGSGAGADGYGVRPDYGTGPQDMTARARSVEAQFGLVSKHPVVPTGSGAGNVNSVECANCHNPHEVTMTSPVSNPSNTYTAYAYTGTADDDAARATFCLKCHSAAALPAYTVTGATLVPSTVTIAAADQSLMNKSTNAGRGHWTANGSIGVTERVTCAECHDNHASNAPKLLGTYDAATGTSKIGATTISANNNAVCEACHTGVSTGYASPVRDAANGYLLDGTWPGSTTYTQAFVADMSGNGHLQARGVIAQNSLPTSYPAGDCKVCHDVHGTANGYDETRLAFTPTDFTLCFDCHDVNGPATSNIKVYYPTVGTGQGHQIMASTATLPAGSGLPCYDCHNPHGNSNAAYGLTVITETASGVTLVLGDAVNEIKMSSADKATPANVRNFCFACHTTSDTGKGWNGGTLAVVTAGAEVEGIDRTVYDDANGLVLRLPDNVADHREAATSKSCYGCHGNDYSVSGQNVHNPSGGISAGGQDCYGCHTAYQQHMEDDAGTKTGASNALSYHHVLGGAAGDGDKAFAAGSYPNLTTEVYCLSCHVDHNLFNTPGHDLAANLRPDLGASPAAGAASDWSDTTNSGVCTACHGTNSLTKSTAAEKLADGRTQTPTVNNTDYDTSAHKYAVNSTFTSDATPAFSASCAKCHNDEQTKEYQNSSATFGTHWSANQHILSALGGGNGGALQEEHCYRCHAEATDFGVGKLAGTAKVNGRDWYDATAMTTAGTEKVYKQFNLNLPGGSRHPVEAAGGDSVECESCHNAHEVSASSKVSDPEDTYTPFTYTGVTNQPAFCLKCHDGVLPTQSITVGKYVPYAITQQNLTINNKSDLAKTSKGHWTTSGSIADAERVSCAQCHDNHGSNAPKLLGVYDPATGTNKIGTTTITANSNTVCFACHTAATGAVYTREANGYPSYGTWTGLTVYNTDIHSGATVKWPGRTDAVGGECWNCHDVHGTNSTYDELLGQYNPSSAGNDKYALCLTCHDGGPSTRNIAQYYPVSAGGTATGSNAGHVIKTTESGSWLPQGTPLPCYDCHNPHGSGSAEGLVVMSEIAGVVNAVGDAAGEIDLTSAAGVRRFCFLCHTTATNRGTSATGLVYANITANDEFEGIERTEANGVNALKLSTLAAHTEADGRSCLTCHGGMTASSATNVHNPSSGAGGGPCLSSGCHGSDSTERLDKMANDVTTYHHVLDGGDQNTVPTASQTTIYCLSCHVDHANFNTAAGNLRSAYNDSGTAGTNSDFPGAGSYGVCISCHSVEQTKSGQGTLQKAGGSAKTLPIAGITFDASAHDYLINDPAKVGYAGDAFRANCIKCHDDSTTAPSTRQGGTYRLAPHYSADNRIAQALGAVLTGAGTSSEENLCYKCHSGGGTADAFGAAVMTARTTGIATQFTKTYRHNVAGYAGIHKADEYTAAPAQVTPVTAAGWWGAASGNKHVECEDCHDVHAAQNSSYVFPSANSVGVGYRAPNTAVAVSGANAGTWGVDVNGSASGKWDPAGTAGTPVQPTYNKLETVTYEWQLCLKCHSKYAWGTGTPPNTPSGQGKSAVTGGTARAVGQMTDVGKDFSPTNYAYHPLFKIGRNQPPPSGAQSNAAWQSTTGTRVGYTTIALGNTMVDGWFQTSLVTCSDCHGNDSWSATVSSGPHASAQPWILRGTDTAKKVTPASGGTAITPNSSALAGSGNFCINCHRADVYGLGGDQGSFPNTSYENLSRHGHRTDQAAKCGGGDYMTWEPQDTGCFLCHGGRGNDADQAVGMVHGSSMTQGDGASTAAAGNDTQNTAVSGDMMGKRFCNGAGWDHHTLGDVSGNVGCSPINTANQYSSCTNHSAVDGKTSAPQYWYPWQ